MASQNNFGILSDNAIPVKQDAVITLTKENSESIDQKKKQKCKILKFSSEWKFDEILSTISRLESKIYPNLFIFIIGDENLELLTSKTEEKNRNEKKLKLVVEILKKNLLDFNKNRSMILQLTTKDENVTKFYYKEEISDEFHDIKEPTAETEDFVDFPTFLWLYLSEKVDDFKDLMLRKLPKVKNSSLILRFLRTLEPLDDFFSKLVLQCAAEGSKSDLLAVIDGYIDGEGNIQGTKAKSLISSEITSTTVLHTSISNSNQEVVKFLVKYCTNLIQQLPFDHQVDISTLAYETNQIDVLCDSVELCDFPFPNDFDPDSVTNNRLCRIIYSRKKFNDDVINENLEGVKSFLKKNSKLIFAYDVDNSPAYIDALAYNMFKSFLCLMENSAQTLDKNDFERFILEKGVFRLVVNSEMDVNGMEKFLDNIKSKTDSNFVCKMLKAKDDIGRNLLFRLAYEDIQKFRAIFQAMNEFLTAEEISEEIKLRDCYGYNILHNMCTMYKKSEFLAIIWDIFENFFSSTNSPHEFRELITQKVLKDGENILHIAARWCDIESHQILWKLLLKIFENREELKDLMLQANEEGLNFIHKLITNYIPEFQRKPDMIGFTFIKVKENFSEVQYEEILMSKDRLGRNFLQYATCKTKDVHKHQSLWKIFRNFCKSKEEFLKILTEVDKHGDNVFNLAACLTSDEVFKSRMKDLEKFASREEIRKILSTLGHGNENLLQSAVKHNKLLRFHKSLWETMRKYFTASEILEMIKHVDLNGDDLLWMTVECSLQKIVEETWNEIQEIFRMDYNDGLMEYVSRVNKNGETVIHALMTLKDEKKLKYFWTELENLEDSHQFVDILNQKATKYGENFLHYAAFCDKIDFHETLWELLLNTLENLDELKDFIMQGGMDGYNYVHYLAAYDRRNIIELTLRKIYENFSDDQYEEILKSKAGKNNRNLLQIAESDSKDIKTLQFLWEIFQDFCKSNEEFLEILDEVDSKGNNVFHLAAYFPTNEVFEFLIQEFEKIASSEEIKDRLSALGMENINLLQAAVRESKVPEFHKSLWKIIRRYFKSSEILDMIKHCDDIGYNLISTAILIENPGAEELIKIMFQEMKEILNKNEKTELMDSLKEVIDGSTTLFHRLINVDCESRLKLFWEEFENIFALQNSSKQFKELLSLEAPDLNKNILHYASHSDKFVFHETFWELLLNTFDNREELKVLMMQEDKIGENFIHRLVIRDRTAIIELTMKKIKENFSDEQYEEILNLKEEFERNLPQYKADFFKDMKRHQIIWENIRNSNVSSEYLFENIKKVDKNGNNGVHLAAFYLSSRVAEFWVDELKNIASNTDIKGILGTLGQGCRNLLQSAAKQNKSLEFHQSLWKVIRKYFDSSEIVDMINHTDEDGVTLLHICIECNTREVSEFTWKEIQTFITTRDDQVEYLSRKGYNAENLIKLSLENQANDSEVNKWVETLMIE